MWRAHAGTPGVLPRVWARGLGGPRLTKTARLRHMAQTATRTQALDVLEAIQQRVLWLSTSIIHHANRVRETPSGVKVGGHQASSASMASIMTALWFGHLAAADPVSVKPHAAPVLHAINYLLGELDRSYLTELRT